MEKTVDKPTPSIWHSLAFFSLLIVLALAIINKHLDRIQLSYKIGKLKQRASRLKEEEKRLETLMATATNPESLLKKSKLLDLKFISQAKARPAEGALNDH